LTFHKIQSQIDEATAALTFKQKARYALWLVRAAEAKGELKLKRPDQTFLRVAPPALESRFRGVLHLLGKRPAYEEAGQWLATQQLIRKEVDESYLGELLRDGRKRLDAIVAGAVTELSDEPATAGP
jgi:hypothetical protein